MNEQMRNRGPDDEGYISVDCNGRITDYIGLDTPDAVRLNFPYSNLVSRSFDHKKILVMGHRRLSILDISPSGHQPMSCPRGRYSIVFNGEIYNFKEIRADLVKSGYSFKSTSDTEVILAAYAEWKEECLQRFNGDFAFAIWDNKDKSLFCARDRVGIKPFYYILDDEKLIFGSDIKTLIASGLYRPEPDPQGLYLAMAFGISPRPITAFKGITALEQAHWMRVDCNGRIKKERYWKIPVGIQDHKMQKGDAVDLLEEQLERSIRRRLVADVSVGTFMSGGIDSTTISALAAKQHPGIKAFTLGYQNDAPELDEVLQAEATARLHPMEHIVARVNQEESLCDLSAWVSGYEEPFYSLAANFVISKLVKENNVTVVLNGLGGDELFAGYSYHRYHRIPQLGWLNSVTRHAKLIPNEKFSRALQMVGSKSPDRLHTLLFRQAGDRELRKLFSPSMQPRLETPDLLHHLYAKGVKFEDTLEAFSYMDLMNLIGNHHVHRIDQFTMAHSVEGRFPLLDHELVEAAFQIPSKLKISGNQQKYVLRKVAEKYIAKECLLMKKKGFGLPLAQWMQGSLKPLVEKSLAQLSQRPEVNGAVISNMYKDYQLNRIPPTRIWHLVALELWFQKFIDPGRQSIPTRVQAFQ